MANYLDYDGLLYVKGKLDNKYVAQEAGKGLSTNDFTTALKNKLDGIDMSNYYTSSEVDGLLDDKVDVVAGKGLSTNDYDNTEKAKVDGAIANPSSKTNGDFLKYNGSAWVAATIPASGVLSVSAGDSTISVDSADASNPKVSMSSAYKALVDNAVPSARTINGKALSADVELVPADLGIGSVFTIKGSKATKTALPSSGNIVGDVWYVIDESVGYVWLNDGTTERWEMLGMTVDLSGYWAKADLVAITNAQIDTIFA